MRTTGRHGALRTLRINLRHWGQVERLCEQRHAGAVRLTVRSASFAAGDRLVLAVQLPNRSETRIPARVMLQRSDPRGDTPELTIELTGLTAYIVDRLRLLAATAIDSPPVPPESKRVAAGTPPPEIRAPWQQASWPELMTEVCGRMRVSELIASNQRLRERIDQLAARMLAPC